MRRGVTLLGISFLISKVLGLLRDNLLAANFGAGDRNPIFNLDTYYAAFRLPDLLFNLMSYGVLSAAFVPLFVEILKKENRENAFLFANQVLHVVSAGVLVLSSVLFIFAPYVLKLFVPGFSEEALAVTVTLTRLMLISPLFFTIGSISGGIQNSLHKFFGLAMAPIVYNAGIIGGVLFFGKTYGVYGITIGVVVGAFLNALVQIPGILAGGYKYMWPKIWLSPRVKEMIKLSIPRIFGMSGAQISLVVDTIIASTLATGSITIINFASNLESLPVGVIGISVAIVSFGVLAAHAALGNREAIIQEISNGIHKITILLVPLALGMASLRLPIVRIFLGRGKFNLENSIVTADTLAIFLSGLVFGGLVFLLARGFYALKNTKTPVVVGLIAVALNIAASIGFTRGLGLGTYGLAAANALANICNATLLIILLSKQLKTLVFEPLEVLKYFVAGLLMTGSIEFTKYFILANDFASLTYSSLVVNTAICVTIGTIIYIFVCLALRCKHIKSLLKIS